MNGNTGNVVTGRAKVIVLISLLAGTLDLLAAIVVYQVSPIRLLKVIAGGAVGMERAIAGNFSLVMLGMIIHYAIALFWTALFFLIYPKVSILKRNIVITGLLYGVIVWLIMNLIVLPWLSQIPQSLFVLSDALIGMVILMVMIGLPVAVLTHRYYRDSV